MEDRPDAFVVSSRSSLGWFALAAARERLISLAFGRRSKKQALEAIGADRESGVAVDRFTSHLVQRLVAYADGQPDDFLDIDLWLDHLTPFGQRVVRHCRQITIGATLTYGQLASKAGSPRAARAVGNIMRNNRFPIVVPCHRVVAACSLGGYSAPDGLDMKKRLLVLESEMAELHVV